LFGAHEPTKSPIAEEVLQQIKGFHAIVAEITDKTADERQKTRRLLPCLHWMELKT